MAYDGTKPVTGGSLIAADMRENFRALKEDWIITGQTVQTVNTQTGAVSTTTALIPYDDTIPQNTEGKEIMTLAITPKNVANKLKIETVVHLSSSQPGKLTIALFQDAISDALAASSVRAFASLEPHNLKFTHFMAAGTTNLITFKIRMGNDYGSTTTFNGYNGARRLGGRYASSITISELKV